VASGGTVISQQASARSGSGIRFSRSIMVRMLSVQPGCVSR
jgi:hypothetical protein